MFTAYDMMVMDEIFNNEEENNEQTVALEREEEFRRTVGFNSHRNYYVAHAESMNMDAKEMILLKSIPVCLDEALRLAKNYINKQKDASNYPRYLTEKNGVVIEDYGSWSDFIYYIPMEVGSQWF